MKFLKYFLLSFTSIILISACQKELSFDVDGNAKGTLKSDLTGDCLPSTVNGIFKADSLLNNTNFIDIQVEISTTGAYEIKSDTINGYSFKGTGTLGITGLNTVRLYASGKPIVTGTDAFTIQFGTSTCVANVIVVPSNVGMAVYTLETILGTCSGAIANGTYTAGTALGINNTVNLTVNVVTPGTYFLGVASVNGMVFSSTGVFPASGLQSVTLNGAGLPVSAGIFNLTASNASSSCTFSVLVSPAGGGSAVFTLNGMPGSCSGAVVAGTYEAGTALSSANTVTLNVTVVTPGTYSVSANTVNGMSFSGSGSFTTTGVQPVILTGSGTPIVAGSFNDTAIATLTNCIFSIIVTNPVVQNQDYIPETAFSNWSDKLVGGAAADTSYVQVSQNTIIRNSLTYHIFETKALGSPTDSSLHRKNGGLYYQLFDQSYGFDNPFNTDGLMLDSNQAVNATWIIDLGNNTVNGGLPATGKINCKIIEKGATAVVAGNTYTNIIKVTYTYSYNIGSGDTDFAKEEIWYAKGKGVVNYIANDIPVTFTDVYETTRIQIF